MTEKVRAVSDYLLERYVLNELPSETMERISKLSETEPDVRNRIQAIRESDEAILAEFPVEEMTAAIIHKSHTAQLETIERRQKRFSAWVKPLLIGAPIAALLIATILINPFPTGGGSNPYTDPLEVTRLKGLKPFIFVYRQNGDQIEILNPGAVAKENDVLQVSYIAAQAPYGVIVSIDGRGVVTPHLPNTVNVPATATALKDEGEILLPYAYKLDDAPKFEIFFFVVSLSPINIQEVLDAAQRFDYNQAGGNISTDTFKLDLPDDRFNQTSFIIRKEEQ